jgi:hypothetical protein
MFWLGLSFMAGYRAAFSTPAARATIMIRKDIIELFRVPPGEKILLRDYNPGWAQTKEMKELGKDDMKERARIILEKNLEDIAEAQERLWADDHYAVLVVLQPLDAAGKDGTIKHVMSGVNPQGCEDAFSATGMERAPGTSSRPTTSGLPGPSLLTS